MSDGWETKDERDSWPAPLVFYPLRMAGLNSSNWTLMVYPSGDPATKSAHAILSACMAQTMVCLTYVVIGASLPHLLGGSLRGVFATIFFSIAVSFVTLLASLTMQATITQFLPFLIGLAINISLAQQTQRMATAAGRAA